MSICWGIGQRVSGGGENRDHSHEMQTPKEEEAGEGVNLSMWQGKFLPRWAGREKVWVMIDLAAMAFFSILLLMPNYKIIFANLKLGKDFNFQLKFKNMLF